jgi:glycosyltransferase involved in cell wall biosynthesis
MDLSVVIPAHNEEHTLPRQLDALVMQEWDGNWEIIVVDNASTDRTAEVVAAAQARNGRIRLISETTLGLCHARNAGIRAATASAIAVCDADDLVSDRWVAAMGEALKHHDFVTGPQELDRLNEAWLAASRGRNDMTTAPTFRSLFPFPNGNNFGLKKGVIAQVGEFDQAYIGAEDVEFGLRAWISGLELHYEPQAVVHYAFRSSSGELWRQGLAYGRNRPAIARLLAQGNLGRPPRLAGWRSWVWLFINAWRLVTKRGRARWAWVAGNRIGHLVGSVRHRTILL